MSVLYELDCSILLFLQTHVRCAPLSAVFIPLTMLGEAGILWIILCIPLLFFPKTRKAGWMTLLSMLLCYLFNDHVLKPLVERPRPFLSLDTLDTLVTWPGSHSFPSGHACSSVAAAATFWQGLKGKGVDWFRYLAVVLAVLMVFSRMYVGVHYPTDVLAGSLVGFAGSSLIWITLNRRYDRIEARILERRQK